MSKLKNIFSAKRSHEDDKLYRAIKKITGLTPDNINIYRKAFTHRSMGLVDDNGYPISYERLEFLGDSVLGTIISEYLYHKTPQGDEGYLTGMRSKIVSRKHLNELGKDFKLIEFAQTQVPESQFGLNVHGNLFEALVGAIYVDKGYKSTQHFIKNRVIKPYVDIDRLEGKITSYKSILIEWCQKNKKTIDYHTYEDTGVNEAIHFAVRLSIDQRVVSSARDTSKKKAEEKASKRAYFALQSKMES